MLVAKKTDNKAVSSCLFTFIRGLPENINEGRDIAFKLKELRNQLGLHETHISETLSARKVDQNRLLENLDNLFRYIACEDLRLVRMWERIEEQAGRKLVPFSLALEKLGGKITEGVELDQICCIRR